MEPEVPVGTAIEAVIDDEELTALTLSLGDPAAFMAEHEPEIPVEPVRAPEPEPVVPVMPRAPFNIRPAIFDPTQYAEDARIADGWPVPADFKLPRKAYGIGDTLIDLVKFDTVAKKVLWLRHNDRPAFRYILKLAFADIKWLLPHGTPPFKEHKGRPGSSPSELLREAKRLYLFLEGGPNLTRLKREKLFQVTIEGLEPNDVKALVALKDKTVEATFGLTANMAEMAFPGLLTPPFNVKFG